MRRQFARVVMIEVANGRSSVQQAEQRASILVERNIEHGDHVIAVSYPNALKQLDVAFDAGDQCRAAGLLDQTKLLQGAQSVRVAVECIVVGHVMA